MTPLFQSNLRILMSTAASGGIWTYATELSRALAEKDCCIGLAVMGGPLALEQRREAEGIPNLELFESDYKLEWMADPWKDLEAAGSWLLERETEFRPDVVHLNGYVHATLAWSAPVVVVGHSCILSWWDAVKWKSGICDPPSAVWGRYQTEARRGLRAAASVVAPTQATLAALQEAYGSFGNAHVVPNGRTASLFPPAVKHPYILAIGRIWDEAKNIAVLDPVAAQLQWPVYVAGELPHPDARRPEVRSLRGLGQLGMPELAHWLAHASIFTAVARYEPFGLSILEAALAGCSLVLGDIDSLREIWDGAACFVPPDDPRLLQNTLYHLIHDPQQRATLAQLSRTRALELSPQKMAEGYLSAYEEAIASRQYSGQHAA